MSISPQQLRLGNYLSVPDAKIEATRVRALEPNYIVCENCSGDIDFFKAIPLTEEWLLRFGFTFGIKLEDFVKGKHQFVEKGKFSGLFSEKGYFYFSIETKIQYVHQLQNTYYAITGEELILKS